MKYKEIETECMGMTQKHIVIDNEDESFTSFPANESYPDYVAFLAQLEKKEDK